MRTAIVLVALLFAGTATAATVPEGFNEALRLEPAASYVAGKHVTVACAADEVRWLQFKRPLYGDLTVYASSVPGTSLSYFAPIVCRTLLARLNGKPVNTYTFAASVLGLVHESIHLRGERNEGVTDCAAVHEMPGVLVRYFHVKPGRELRAVMAQAWRYRATETAPYRTVC